MLNTILFSIFDVNALNDYSCMFIVQCLASPICIHLKYFFWGERGGGLNKIQNTKILIPPAKSVHSSEGKILAI